MVSLRTRFSTADMNPTIDPAFLARQREIDPDGYLSEYEARFVDGGGQYLEGYLIDNAARLRHGDLAPEDGFRWTAGLDPAFSRDPFGLVIVGQDPRDWKRLVVGCVRGWQPAQTPGDGSFEPSAPPRTGFSAESPRSAGTTESRGSSRTPSCHARSSTISGGTACRSKCIP